MLEGMRRASQGTIGKFVMTIVMGLIIVSFVVWGVGDMLRGFTATTVAKVGGTAIARQQYENELQSQLYILQRRLRQPVTAQQARALGLDAQVLERMIDEAAFDERARAMGLGVSDRTIAEVVRSDPRMKGADGRFDATKFDAYLRDAGLTEQGFIAAQRGAALRQQIEYALVDGLAPPKPLVRALLDSKGETRAISYFVLTPAGGVPPPADDVLKAYFEAHKAAWRAPEYRSFTELVVTPATLAKPGDVGDADARAQYDKDKATKYSTPETRKLQQIVFPSEAEAAEADGRIKSGTSFEDVAKARNLADADLNLGETTRAGLFDPALADAAFALPQGGVSGPIKGKFGYVLVKVVSIAPGATKAFDAIEGAIRQEIAAGRAAEQVQGLHDKIEDARGAGKPLSEAAASVGLAARVYDAVDRDGKTPGGGAADVTDMGQVLPGVFGSDVGVDDEPIATKDNGYVWFSVTRIEPAHERGFEEVKGKVAEAWEAEETQKRLADAAAQAVKRLDAGGDVADAARSANAEVKTAADLRRDGGGGLAREVAAAVFGVGPSGAGSAPASGGRLVFKVTADAFPAPAAGDPEAAGLPDRLKTELGSSLVAQYVEALKREIGVSIDAQAFRSAEGG